MTKTASEPTGRSTTFRVIGIGASAGGIEAFKSILAAMGAAPLDVAVVYITHLSASDQSHLPAVFSATTSMAVVPVTTKVKVEINTIYVNTERDDVVIEDGYLLPVPRIGTALLHRPIDLFFESLASEQANNAEAVLLSGTGTDGTIGLHAIQNAQGQAVAQLPESARRDGIIRSAVEAGFVDRLLSLDAIAAHIRGHKLPPQAVEKASEHHVPAHRLDSDAIGSILAQLHHECGVDFTSYKRASVLRRITHAMHQVGQTSLASYAESLKTDAGALSDLFKSMLIHVTAFFRDPLAFEVLKQKVFPEIFRHRSKEPDMPVRIWVPGCSTGEEAYSVAIAYHEYADAHGHPAPLQLFATDLSEAVLATARTGIYSSEARSSIDAGLAKKYFTDNPAPGRIVNTVRSSCVFSRHHVIDDPPFSRLDLITCRNLLIYLENTAQARALSVFHYALRASGFLLLGRSESAYTATDLFAATDRITKIYRRLPSRSRPTMRMRVASAPALLPAALNNAEADTSLEKRATAGVHATVANILDPMGVVVDEELKITDFHGAISTVLAPVSGRAVLSLARMAPARLTSSVRKLVQQAKKEGGVARQSRVTFVRGGERCVVDVGVARIPEQTGTNGVAYLVLFSSFSAVAKTKSALGKQSGDATMLVNVNRLESELEASHEHVRVLTGDYQQATDALNTLNEELLSGNEELQSLNEELETAKEELESGNEELSTLNDELHIRNTTLGEVNSDLLNIMSTIDVPLIIIDRNRCIRRFTTESRQFIHCIPTDMGRRVDDLSINFERPTLLADIQQVIDHGKLVEFQISMPEGEWYNVQIRPYVAADVASDSASGGAVIAFVRITALKNLISKVEQARDWAREIVEAVPRPLVILDATFKITSVNNAFTEILGVSRDVVVGEKIFDTADGALHSVALRELLEKATDMRYKALRQEIQLHLTDGMRQIFAAVARSIPSPSGNFVIIVSLEDITEQLAAERQAIALAAERQSRIEAEKTNQAKDDFLAMLSHELRTPLAAISLRTQLMLNDATITSQVKEGLQLIEQSAQAQNALVEDLLDVSRIVAGKMRLRKDLVSFDAVVRSALDAVSSQAHEKGIDVAYNLFSASTQVLGDADRLQQVVGNLLNNAIKFTPSGGHCTVRLRRDDSVITLEVADNGLGLAPEMREKIFERFAQKDSSSSRQHGGLGLGLNIVRHLTELHGGSVDVQSGGIGRGATFYVTLPSADVTGDKAEGGMSGSSPTTAVMSLRGKSALVIDDDHFLRNSIHEILAHENMAVKAAASAAEGLELLKTFSPDVILCDINMPGEDGYAFVRSLGSKHPSLDKVPAIAITALASSRDEQQMLDEGFTFRLVKPFRIATLLDVVRTAIFKSAKVIGSERIK